MAKAFVTGSAGFIGYHLCQRLLADGWDVTGLDAMTDYYDVSLKEDRSALLRQNDRFVPIIGRLEEPGLLTDTLATGSFDVVIHLAAQAGVRYSIDAPETYLQSNLIGTFNLLEAVRHNPVQHLLMASTSSIYGANSKMPYAETDKTTSQMSFYAATKAANEAMAHSYAHLYHQPITLFRFFTVYGTWGRPDMAYFKFAKNILNNEPIDVYNHGDMRRDFTFVDDLIEALIRLIPVAPSRPNDRTDVVPEFDSISKVAPHRVVNIGNAQPVELMKFISAIEQEFGMKADINFMDMQAGDVPATWADTRLLRHLTGFSPSTPIEEGIASFAKWYLHRYTNQN